MLSTRISAVACGRSALRPTRVAAFGAFPLASGSASRVPNRQAPSLLFQRPVATQKIPPENNDILVKQRKNRPVAPHLGVYDVQQTWFGTSAWMRMTGLALSGGFYAFFLGHLLAPAFGTHFGTDQLVAAYTALSPTVQSACKFGAAFPFVFHFLNGIKQLVYDTGAGWSRNVITYLEASQWVLSVLGTTYLAFIF